MPAPASRSPAHSTAPLGRATPLLFAVGVAVVGAITGATSYLISDLHHRTVRETERELGNLALMLAEQTDRSIQAVHLAQQAIIDRVASLEIATPEDFERQAAGHGTHHLMQDKIAGLPYVDALILSNAKGKLVNFSRSWPAPGFDLSDREHFVAFKNDPHLGSYITAPVRSLATGAWNFYVAQRITSAKGTFLGNVLAAVRLDYFDKLFAGIALEPTSSITLIREDGVLLVRYPHIETAIGRRFSGVTDTLDGKSKGTAHIRGHLDGRDRIFAAHRVGGHPLVAVIGLEKFAVLAKHEQQASLFLASGAISAISVAGLLFMVGWRVRRGHKESQRSLRDKRLQLDVALNNMPHGLCMFDRENKLVFWNDSYTKMYNLPADLLREGSTLLEMLELRKAAGTLGDDPAWHAEELARVMSDGKTSTHTRELADGRVISVKARPMHDGAWVVIHEDITEARRIEKERKQIEEQLQRAQRMETVGRLTGGIAHDFNNLLLVMIGNLDLLLDELQHNPNACEKVDTIINASLRGAELTRQLLAFARRQPLQPKNVDAKKLAQRTARLLSRTLGENIKIQVMAPDDLWLAKVDEAQLEAALVNIAINARDAMPNGGTLSIAAANVTMSERVAARIGEIEAGDYVWLEISDTGTGMPPEVLAQIFEPFFTTKETGKGTGLGLSMVYGFVKQSEGHVEARSEVGQGTSIQIFLPRGEPARSTREAGGASATIPHGRGELILVVDDNAEARATAMKQLNSLGYRTLEADAAEPALSLIEARNDVDLLFTDVVMPGRMNGPELADMARKLRPNLRVLITSGFPGSLATANDNGARFASFLPKPYRRAELADAIRRTLKGASAVAADADEEKASARARAIS